MNNIDQKIAELEEYLRNNREDEEAWLVLGDALLEKGSPRGEVIMLERKRDQQKNKKKRNKIQNKIDNIIKNNKGYFLGSLSNPILFNVNCRDKPVIKNGYLHTLHISINTARSFKNIFTSPAFRMLSSLYLTGGVFAELYEIINIIKKFNLSSLEFLHSKLSIQDLQTISNSGIISTLSHFGLGNNALNDDDLKIIIPELQRLKSLSLSIHNLTDESISHLVKGYYPNLERLNLRGNFIEINGYNNLVRCKDRFPSIKKVDLSINMIDINRIADLDHVSWINLQKNTTY